MKKLSKKTKYLILGIVFALALVFAALLVSLEVNGVMHIRAVSFDVHFENIQITSGSAEAISDATITDATAISLETNLDPGEYYEFTVDVVNDGTIDAQIRTLNVPTFTTEESKYMEFDMKYDFDKSVRTDDIIEAGETYTIDFKLYYKNAIFEDLPSSINNKDLSIEFEYEEKNEDGNEVYPDPADFATDSWKTIINSINIGFLSKYEVGDTRCIALDGFTTTNNNGCENGEFLLRIVNKSVPEVCYTEGFSESACGFVVEFVDVISEQKMKDENTNAGGWSASNIRSYVNNDIYNALPNELKKAIMETHLVSGHNSTETTNFVSTDKLYLPASHEIWENATGERYTLDEYDSSYNKTRQLDYYASLNTTINNYSPAIKKFPGSQYPNETEIFWLRSSASNDTKSFLSVIFDGSFGTNEANYEYGVSPMFRMGIYSPYIINPNPPK